MYQHKYYYSCYITNSSHFSHQTALTYKKQCNQSMFRKFMYNNYTMCLSPVLLVPTHAINPHPQPPPTCATNKAEVITISMTFIMGTFLLLDYMVCQANTKVSLIQYC